MVENMRLRKPNPKTGETCCAWDGPAAGDGYALQPYLHFDEYGVLVGRVLWSIDHDMTSVPDGWVVGSYCGDQRCTVPRHKFIYPAGLQRAVRWARDHKLLWLCVVNGVMVRRPNYTRHPDRGVTLTWLPSLSGEPWDENEKLMLYQMKHAQKAGPQTTTSTILDWFAQNTGYKASVIHNMMGSARRERLQRQRNRVERERAVAELKARINGRLTSGIDPYDSSTWPDGYTRYEQAEDVLPISAVDLLRLGVDGVRKAFRMMRHVDHFQEYGPMEMTALETLVKRRADELGADWAQWEVVMPSEEDEGDELVFAAAMADARGELVERQYTADEIAGIDTGQEQPPIDDPWGPIGHLRIAKENAEWEAYLKCRFEGGGG
jgi:hypothetical protein